MLNFHGSFQLKQTFLELTLFIYKETYHHKKYPRREAKKCSKIFALFNGYHPWVSCRFQLMKCEYEFHFLPRKSQAESIFSASLPVLLLIESAEIIAYTTFCKYIGWFYFPLIIYHSGFLYPTSKRFSGEGDGAFMDNNIRHAPHSNLVMCQVSRWVQLDKFRSIQLPHTSLGNTCQISPFIHDQVVDDHGVTIDWSDIQ